MSRLKTQSSTLNRLPGVLLAAATVPRDIEEPEYTVVQTNDDFELRHYAPYLVAEVVVPGPAEAAGNKGFNILAEYLFGRNAAGRSFERAAPVNQSALPSSLGVGAPVTQSVTDAGFLVQFVMPAGESLASMPQPLDERVRLREYPERTQAVTRYSGSWSQRNYEQHLETLEAAVARAGIVTEGEPIFSRYDAPFVLPFLRRNEVWLTVA